MSLSVFPWELSIEADGGPADPPAAAPPDSRLNRLPCEVTTVTTIGSRARVGLAVPSRSSPR
ncbi:MAG: hypothetical protein JSS68_16045 [Actinobacteria bacterium]|nr:hypothetical protein [Actinomycetota bacterium]